MRIAHLDVVTENIVIAYLQTGDFRQFTLTLLYLQEIILAGISYLSQFVQLGIDTGLDDSPFINQQRRVVINLPGDTLTDGLADIQLFADMVQACIISVHASLFDGCYGLQGNLQCHHFTGRDTAYGNLGDNTFQVAYQV